jgi:hypothetical protein
MRQTQTAQRDAAAGLKTRPENCGKKERHSLSKQDEYSKVLVRLFDPRDYKSMKIKIESTNVPQTNPIRGNYAGKNSSSF